MGRVFVAHSFKSGSLPELISFSNSLIVLLMIILHSSCERFVEALAGFRFEGASGSGGLTLESVTTLLLRERREIFVFFSVVVDQALRQGLDSI